MVFMPKETLDEHLWLLGNGGGGDPGGAIPGIGSCSRLPHGEEEMSWERGHRAPHATLL